MNYAAVVEDRIDELKSICIKNKVIELYLFGSAASDYLSESSDLDFAVLFSDNLSPLEHGSAYFSLKDDLEELFNREIDLVSYRVVKNAVFKEQLDQTKISLYAA